MGCEWVGRKVEAAASAKALRQQQASKLQEARGCTAEAERERGERQGTMEQGQVVWGLWRLFPGGSWAWRV